MAIDNQKVVSVTYQLSVNDFEGEVVETVDKEKPLTFLYGVGNMLEKFEENIKGLQEGDSFNFKIPSEEAYGQASEDAIVELPIDTFKIEGEIDYDLLKEGNYIPMQDQEGNRLDGIVLEVGEEKVKMDFNHPLAGDDLFFKGEVLSVREASEDEINQGYVSEAEGI
ncbi:MAG: FKBP-type peptidyl-prolyl cis-trans isomerase [Bacteroidales bacterium]|nr:FKBP-type peptidyl-prolyl cis-trans isomerase [Bacteroidales bacterium]MBS3775396.1 FKBP-type peptidyl-prolyl cis-trans isomerase [Bacteroidales bacterium]